MNEDDLEKIAQQLAARIREDDPLSNARWLAAEVPDPNDWFRLCFVLGTAIPVDVPWSHLTAWTRLANFAGMGDGRPDTPEKIEQRRRDLNEALDGADPRQRRRPGVAWKRGAAA